MADEPKSVKRIVKSPETFRERAVKAAEEGDKPKRTSSVKTFIGKILKPIFRPIGKLLRRIGRLKPIKFVGKIIFPEYFRSSWRELKLVRWPNWKQSRQLTFAVLVFAVIFGVTIAVVDYGLDKIFRNLLLK